MREIVVITLKGIFRDRVFQGIMGVGIIFLFIPAISSLSMRQVTELSITLSLSLLSIILLLLSVFLGATSVWKDIERRYTFSVISLPFSRTTYLLGKYIGISLFIFLATCFLAGIASVVIWVASGIYPSERPIVWINYFLCILFDALKYILLVAYAFLFSTVSTSFFLPIFGTITVYFMGNATQQVQDYLNSAASSQLSPFIRSTASMLYYILPNFSAFDLNVNAIYGLAVPIKGILLPPVYFIVYTSLIMMLSAKIFARREML